MLGESRFMEGGQAGGGRLRYVNTRGLYFPTGIIINSAPQNANVLYRSLEVSIAQKG